MVLFHFGSNTTRPLTFHGGSVSEREALRLNLARCQPSRVDSGLVHDSHAMLFKLTRK